MTEVYIKIKKDGPYLVYGNPKISEKVIISNHKISIKYGDGKTFDIVSSNEPISLCRCGKSKNAPFCDGSHINNFDGTETATKTPVLEQSQAIAIEGPDLTLIDLDQYCAFARFCDRGGRIWNLVQEGKNPELAIEEANLCPAGRLLMFTKSGESLERVEPIEINTIEDSGLGISGPLWLRGGIKVIGEDGTAYEIRNKQTLCRCGASSNKPFCNGAHASINWKAN